MDSVSPFTSSQVKLKVALSPMAVSNPLAYARRQLNGLLHKYIDEISGVLLSYSSLKLDKGREYARIIGEHPWLHVTFTIRCLVFKPEPGLVLTSAINEIRSSHVSVLVLGLFKATVPSEQLRKQYTFQDTSKQWLSQQNGLLLEQGDQLVVVIEHFHELNGVISIDVSLPPLHHGTTIGS